MQKEITLKINPVLTICDYSGDYTRQDLAKAVAYWLEIINNINDSRPLAICFGTGSTTFQTVAILLAIIDSGKNFYKFDQLAPGADIETIKYPKIEGGVSATFITGNVQTNFDYSDDPDIYEVEAPFHLENALKHLHEHSLEVTFRFSQKRYNNTSGTTSGFPKLIEASVGNDGHSIKTAIDNYINEDDHCVFSHSMSHIGVHTTAILPCVFKAQHVSFYSGIEWNDKIVDATHTQYFYTMLSHYHIPTQNKIKTVTTGGDFLTSTLVTELIYNKGVEKIIDIYGLTEAAPPLAIREIRSLDDLTKPFIWVNDAYQCYIDEFGIAVIVRPDNVEWVSNDFARYDETTKEFVYLGRRGADAKIRMSGILMDPFDFRSRLEKETGVMNYFLDTAHVKIPMLHITDVDQKKIIDFIQTYEVTVELKIVDTIVTNGGIKNTRIV